MNRREDLAARLSTPTFREANREADRESEEEVPAPAVRPTARVKRVRRTLDLSPAQHHELKTWANEQAFVLGVAEIPGQHVLGEIVALFLTDVRTQKIVAERLRKRYEEE